MQNGSILSVVELKVTCPLYAALSVSKTEKTVQSGEQCKLMLCKSGYLVSRTWTTIIYQLQYQPGTVKANVCFLWEVSQPYVFELMLMLSHKALWNCVTSFCIHLLTDTHNWLGIWHDSDSAIPPRQHGQIFSLGCGIIWNQTQFSNDKADHSWVQLTF